MSAHNDSTLFYLPWRHQALLVYTLYGIQGSVNLLCGLSITIPVLAYRALRIHPQHLIVAAVTFADAATGFGWFAVAIQRIPIILRGEETKQVDRLECWRAAIGLQMHMFTGSVMGFILFALSIDRVLLMTYPLWHRARRVSYALWLIMPVYLHGLAVFLANVFIANFIQTEPATVSAVCYGPSVLPSAVRSYAMLAMAVGALLSVIACGVVLVKRSRFNEQQDNGKDEQDRIAQQRAFTASFIASTAFTVAFGIVPTCIDVVFVTIGMHQTWPHWQLIEGILFILINFNSTMNFFIFIRHRLYRVALFAALRAKQMPLDTRLW